MQIREKSYTYLPQALQVEDWPEVEAELNNLLCQKINSPDELVHLINHYNELLDVLNDRDIQLWVQLSLDTTNQDVQQEGEYYTEEILSNAKPLLNQIEQKILAAPHLDQLGQRYDNYRKILTKNVRTYHEANLALQAKEQQLCEQYRRIPSTLTFTYEGEERSLGQMKKLLTDEDRQTREAAWRLLKAGWLEKRDELDQIFDQILAVRGELARNCGCSNFREYKHLIRNRFGYSSKDFQRLYQSVEKIVIPALQKLNEEKRNTLQLDQLKPWDETASMYQTSLRPFEDLTDLIYKNELVLAQIDPEFAEAFQLIKRRGHLDLAPRKGKVPGGFCFPIDQTRVCFICMNAVGMARDATILVHESGHGIHALAHADEPIREYRMFDGPGELAEFPCKTMELLALEHYDIYYERPEDVRQAKVQYLMGVLDSLCSYVTSDAFEEWVYTHPNHSARERADYYRSLVERFNPGVNWTGLEAEMSVGWGEKFLSITMPAYIISYALAQLGAIAVYKNYRENRTQTIAQLKEFMKLGFSRPIDELFQIAGIRFDFSEDYLQEMVDFILGELEIQT